MTEHAWSRHSAAMVRDGIGNPVPAGGLPGACEECGLCGALSLIHPALAARLLVRPADLGQSKELKEFPACPGTCEGTAELLQVMEVQES